MLLWLRSRTMISVTGGLVSPVSSVSSRGVTRSLPIFSKRATTFEGRDMGRGETVRDAPFVACCSEGAHI